MTVQVAIATIVLGVGLGLVLAVTRAFAIKTVNALIVVYVDFFRTLPQLVVIIFLYFALPYAGITLSPFAATVLALGAVLSAFATEASGPASRRCRAASGTPRIRSACASSRSSSW